jgi:hypothetical protein
MAIPLQLKAVYLFSPSTSQSLTNKNLLDMSESRTILPHSCAITHLVLSHQHDEDLKSRRDSANIAYKKWSGDQQSEVRRRVRDVTRHSYENAVLAGSVSLDTHNTHREGDGWPEVCCPSRRH